MHDDIEPARDAPAGPAPTPDAALDQALIALNAVDVHLHTRVSETGVNATVARDLALRKLDGALYQLSVCRVALVAEMRHDYDEAAARTDALLADMREHPDGGERR
jgi:hypothetical protein